MGCFKKLFQTSLLAAVICLSSCTEKEDSPTKADLIKAAITAEYDGRKGFSREEWDDLCDGLEISRNSEVFYETYKLPKASGSAYKRYISENNKE